MASAELLTFNLKNVKVGIPDRKPREIEIPFVNPSIAPLIKPNATPEKPVPQNPDPVYVPHREPAVPVTR